MVELQKTTVPSRWVLEDHEKPWTVNAERTWHFQKRATAVRECRERFTWLALEQRIPRLERVNISVVPLAIDRRGIQDVAACLPAAKAAIDGIVDANVLEDDGPQWVRSISFFPTQVVGRYGLRVVISEALPSGENNKEKI